MTDPSFYARVAKDSPAPDLSGASGYFSAPQPELDPHLFEGDHLRTDVRRRLLRDLQLWFTNVRLHNSEDWMCAWIAGSGISYQWAADRGNGDLDVLLGVNLVAFRRANPEFAAFNEADLAADLNTQMKMSLWATDSAVDFNGQAYEVTYFINPGVGSNIRHINPYAAYDLINDTWTVKPPVLASDPRTMYPREWFDRTDLDAEAASVIADRFSTHMGTLVASAPGTADWHNAGSALNVVVQQAQSMFDDIHSGRRDAFGPNGKGYGDWHNFRWQRAKETGTTSALHHIVTVAEEARHEEETAQWGRPIDSAEVVLRRAAQQYQSRQIGR